MTDALTGLPLGGVEVLASIEEDEIRCASTLTMGSGEFSLSVPDNAVFEFRIPGYRPAKIQAVEAEAREMEVALHPLCRLEVLLADETHAPIAGAEVKVNPIHDFGDGSPDEGGTSAALLDYS